MIESFEKYLLCCCCVAVAESYIEKNSTATTPHSCINLRMILRLLPRQQ